MSSQLEEHPGNSSQLADRMDNVNAKKLHANQSICPYSSCESDDQLTSGDNSLSTTTNTTTENNSGTTAASVPVMMWGMQNLVNCQSSMDDPHCTNSPIQNLLQQQSQQASRRKRRKQMAPPQKIYHSCTSLVERLSGLDDSEDTENESMRSDSDPGLSEDETKLTGMRHPKRPCNGISSVASPKESPIEVEGTKGFNTKYTSLINQISQRAVDAIKHCMTPNSLLAPDPGLDHGADGTDTEDKTNQYVERALQHLEPQIARLVGQSIRQSIQTIRDQMLAEMQVAETKHEPNGIGSDPSNCGDEKSWHLQASDRENADTKEQFGFTIGQLSRGLQAKDGTSEQSESTGARESPCAIESSERTHPDEETNVELAGETILDNQHTTLLSSTLFEMNRSIMSNSAFPALVPPLPLVNHWKLGLAHPPTAVTSPSCMQTVLQPMSTLNAGTKHELITSISQISPQSNGCLNKAVTLNDTLDTTGQKPKGRSNEVEQSHLTTGRTEADFSKRSLTDVVNNNMINSLEYTSCTMPKVNTPTTQSNDQSVNDISAWKHLMNPIPTSLTGASTAAATAAILTAFGLTNNPFWTARRPPSTDRGLSPWIPTYPPSLLQWATENLPSTSEIGRQNGCPVNSTLSPFTFIPPVPESTSSIPSGNGAMNPISGTLSMDEQTEALSLVVRGMNKANETASGRFIRDTNAPENPSSSSEGRLGMIPMLSSYSPGTTINYQGSMLSRRKRTKVTDTRMSSRGPRATHCVSPRTNPSIGAMGCGNFGMFRTIEDKASISKVVTSTNMLGGFPISCSQSIGRMAKTDETDRHHSNMLPSSPNMSEVRLNSSSSSPSPNSIRLSGGSRDLGEADSGRLMFDRTSNCASFYSHNPIPSVHGALRHGVGSIANLMATDLRTSEAEAFEQVLAKTFHPNSLIKRSVDATAKSSSIQLSSIFDSKPSSTNPSVMLDATHQSSHAHHSLMSRESRPHSLANITRNTGFDIPGIRAPLNSFGKPNNTNDSLLKRGLHTSLLLPGQCCDADGMIDAQNGTGCVDGLRTTSTLTPVHLRKAKLMFFYTRYPNSTLIKMYFPDVKFYKNNTAQLVKWFSNFREFYYIQMEKFARVAISEGVRSAEEIHVTTDSELYRALNLHYNRNQQLEVPEHFRIVVEATLREFFNALMTGKDAEQSWKKPIYKIIARMDQPVPEFFKNPNWMEQLADG